MFLTKFKYVFYVPGNHELWVGKSTESGFKDSVDKFHKIIALCNDIGVHTQPFKIGEPDKQQVWVVPLFSWYNENLEEPNNNSKSNNNNATQSGVGWSDFFMCRWPPHFIDHPLNPHANRNNNNNIIPIKGNDDVIVTENPISPSDFFLNMNEENINRSYDTKVITFSHFLPRRDVLPPTEFLHISFLPQVSGAKELDIQLRKINSTIHVFGHTHINRNYTIDGVFLCTARTCLS